jgi:hypothetical protein
MPGGVLRTIDMDLRRARAARDFSVIFGHMSDASPDKSAM